MAEMQTEEKLVTNKQLKHALENGSGGRLETLWEGNSYRDFTVRFDNDFDFYDMFLISYLCFDPESVLSCCIPASVLHGQDNMPMGISLNQGIGFYISNSGQSEISFYNIAGYITGVYGLKAGA